MSLHGQYNFRGLDAQTQASILFFLTLVKEPDFDSIVLEDENWEDFTLYFKSGKKIVCESKNRSWELGWAAVKSILATIQSRKTTFSKADRVLIICNGAKEDLVHASDRLKYGIDELREEYKKHGFTEAQIDLLSRTDFYIIPRDRSGESMMYARAQEFFYAYLNFWIPDTELDRLFDSLLYQKFFRGSTKGLKIRRLEIFDEIETFKKDRIKRGGGGIYDAEARKLESQLDDIIRGVESVDHRHLVREDNLSVLSAQPKLMFYLIERLERRSKSLELPQWSFLWDGMLVGFYSFRLQKIFDENLTSPANAKFILGFVSKNYARLSFKAMIDSYAEYYVQIAAKIVKEYPQLSGDALKLTKVILSLRNGEYRDYELSRENEQEKEAVASLIREINRANLSRGEIDDSQALMQLVAKNFSLIDDDGEYDHYTPRTIFEAFEEFLSEDFQENFDTVVSMLVEQYDESKLYRDGFKGREYMGSGVSSSAGHYTIRDRHFVDICLTPALHKFYLSDPASAYEFTKDKLLTLETTKLSREHPDFLNRCAIRVLADEYSKNTAPLHGEQYNLLSSLMDVSGIPDKRELIFQYVRNLGTMRADKKWALVKASLEKSNGLPVNIFVEEIARNQAATNVEAAEYLAKWSTDPESHQHRLFGKTAPSENLRSLLANDKTFKQGIASLKEYLRGDDFRFNTDSFHASDTAPLITEILKTNLEQGLSIMEAVYGHEALSANDQWILTSTLRNLPDENVELGLACYDKFLKPHLKELQTIEAVEARFTNRHSREELIWFAEKLAKQEHFSQALWLAEIFINDTNPRLTNEDDDPNGTFNYHQKVIDGDKHITINTVRGCIPWVLQKFINLRARPYLHRVIQLMAKLCQDQNYYVRTMALVPLTDFVKVRHSVMVAGGADFFMTLEDAMAVKEIAMSTIRNSVNRELRPLMGNLVHVFGNLRSLTQSEAIEVLGYLKPMTDEDIDGDSAVLFIFFAEYRKGAFKKFKREDLGSFDDKPFKALLMDQIENGPDAMKRSLAWHLYKLPKEEANSTEREKAFSLAYKYLSMFTKHYTHSAFEYVYMFLDDNFDSNYEKCFALWKKCLTTERRFFDREAKTNAGELRDKGWWVHWKNKDALRRIMEHESPETFLYWFNYLLDYPRELPIYSDYFDLAESMAQFDDESLSQTIEETFNKLIEINPSFRDSKIEWSNLRSQT